MTSFLETFGASAVSPSEVAFAAYTFSTDLTLYWPQFSAGQTDIAARFMNLTATASSLNVTMPDAMLVSVGYDVIIFNAGSDTFNVVDFNGGAIATIATGQTYYLILNDNTTQAGGWQTVQFGVGTGSASAAALAGAGLLAAAGLLNVNLDIQTQSGDYTISPSSRALLQVWTGGAGTITLPTAASVGDGFFFALANNGSGSVAVATTDGDDIDGAASSIFTQTQSGFIISSGAAWYTVGKGLQNNFSVTLLNLNVAGSADVTETSAQAQNIIQQYTGILTGNINVIVPATVQLYYVFNNTSGTYSLTVKTASGMGVAIPQGTHVILYCDGTNVINAFTTNTATIGSVYYALGTVGGTPNALTGSASNFILQIGTEVSFNPLMPNTGPTTLNVQGTGVIALKKIGAVGLVDLATNDLIPTIPVIAYYDGTYWVALNIIYEGVYQSQAVDFTLTFANWLNNIDCTAALNITLDPTSDFPPYFYTTIFANGGAVTFIPDAGDSIQGLGAGVNYVIPRGGSARLTTDNAGKWTLFLLNVPVIANDTTTNATMYPVWVTANSGSLPLKVSSTKMSFNPSTGVLTSTAFAGNLTGNVTGNVTGNITGTAPAGTLTGNTLAANVTASSLTSVATIISGTWTGSPINVPYGGTGQIALSANRLIYGNGASGVQSLALGTTTQVLHGNAAGLATWGAVVLTTDVSGVLPLANGGTNSTTGAFLVIKSQSFSSSGTYTPSAGMLSATIETWAGGGGGGGVNNTSGAAGGGGGAGGYAKKSVSAATIGASKAVTIGAGGTAGANTGGTGGTGGTTSVGSIVSATGGIGGNGTVSGANQGIVSGAGTGGSGASGDINAQGMSGFPGINYAGGAYSGRGGSTTLGPGGAEISTGASSSPGNAAAANTGAGGGGAISTGTAEVGGVGGSGYVFITEFCSA